MRESSVGRCSIIFSMSLLSTLLIVAFEGAPSSARSENLTASMGCDPSTFVVIRNFGIGRPTGIRYSPDGTHFAVASPAGALVVSVETGLERSILIPSQVIAFSPSRAQLAMATGNEIRVYALDSGELTQILSGHTGAVRTLEYSRDGSRLASGGFDNALKVWEVGTGQLVSTAAVGGAMGEVHWLGASGQIATSVGNQLKTWNSDDGSLTQTIASVQMFGVKSFGVSPDGTRFVTNGTPRLRPPMADPNIKVWSTETGMSLGSFIQGSAFVRWSVDGSQIVATAASLLFFDANSFSLVHSTPLGGIGIFDFSIDGSQVAGVAPDAVRIVDVETGRILNSFFEEGHRTPVGAVSVSSDGSTLASIDNNQLKLWDIASGALLRTVQFPLTGLMSFSPDSTWVAVSDGNLIWIVAQPAAPWLEPLVVSTI